MNLDILTRRQEDIFGEMNKDCLHRAQKQARTCRYSVAFRQELWAHQQVTRLLFLHANRLAL